MARSFDPYGAIPQALRGLGQSFTGLSQDIAAAKTQDAAQNLEMTKLGLLGRQQERETGAKIATARKAAEDEAITTFGALIEKLPNKDEILNAEYPMVNEQGERVSKPLREMDWLLSVPTTRKKFADNFAKLQEQAQKSYDTALKIKQLHEAAQERARAIIASGKERAAATVEGARIRAGATVEAAKVKAGGEKDKQSVPLGPVKDVWKIMVGEGIDTDNLRRRAKGGDEEAIGILQGYKDARKLYPTPLILFDKLVDEYVTKGQRGGAEAPTFQPEQMEIAAHQATSFGPPQTQQASPGMASGLGAASAASASDDAVQRLITESLARRRR